MDNAHSDPKDESSNVKENNREAERGRTILAMVGKAIQDDIKVILHWDPLYKIPRGENRTLFASYIGVITRERININFKKWTDVPKETKDDVYDFIAKGFIIPENHKTWVLSQTCLRWRAFKTRLRKYWSAK